MEQSKQENKSLHESLLVIKSKLKKSEERNANLKMKLSDFERSADIYDYDYESNDFFVNDLENDNISIER